jgi:hypothetical protein
MGRVIEQGGGWEGLMEWKMERKRRTDIVLETP